MTENVKEHWHAKEKSVCVGDYNMSNSIARYSVTSSVESWWQICESIIMINFNVALYPLQSDVVPSVVYTQQCTVQGHANHNGCQCMETTRKKPQYYRWNGTVS